MRHLLAARGRRVVRRDRNRQDDFYVLGQVFGRLERPVSGLMRHLREVEVIEVALLPGRVIRAAGLGPLVLATGLADRVPSRRLCTPVAAVPIPVVAIWAEEEHLPALAADHKP